MRTLKWLRDLIGETQVEPKILVATLQKRVVARSPRWHRTQASIAVVADS